MTPQSQMELFQVEGTTFRFPALPDEPNNPAVIRAQERRDTILATARKVRKPVLKRPRQPARRKQGDGSFTPKPGAPGSIIELSDGQRGEVWSLAPGPNNVWAILADGSCVRAAKSPGRDRWYVRTW